MSILRLRNERLWQIQCLQEMKKNRPVNANLYASSAADSFL